MLEIHNLHASIDDTDILNGVSLQVKPGEVHGILGPNASGKSTLARVIAGDPTYTVTNGEVQINGENILDLPPDERARMGVFLAFQYPIEVPGLSIGNFLRAAYNAVHDTEMPAMQFYGLLQEKLADLKLSEQWGNRYLNEGFSGGEKKRNEILQMMVLDPSICILDETDSGLDVDALKIVSEGVNRMRGAERSIIIVTHYERLLEYIKPDRCHVMMDGQLVFSEDGIELARKIDEHGYDFVRSKLGVE
jgi:Fe-S cluster assembly ATP-binding protein